MAACEHLTLELLPVRKSAVRCRRCHLTLSSEEAAGGYCPECFERWGRRYDDFEELSLSGDAQATYRCERCGVIVKCR